MRYLPLRKLYRNVHLSFDTVTQRKMVVKKFRDRNKLLREYSNNIIIHTLHEKSNSPIALHSVYDVDMLNKRLVLEYIEGTDLFNYIIQKKGRKEDIDHNSIMKDVGESIDWLKTNKLVHLDIKPENFIYDETSGQMSLIDFQSLTSSKGNNKCFSIVGTDSYMSPEMFYEQSFHKNTDLWSMGLMGFIMSEKYNPLHITRNRSSVQDYAFRELKKKDYTFAEKIYHLLHYDPRNRINNF